MQRRPENDDDDGESADDYPNGVAASVAGLSVAYGVADGGGSVSDAVNGAVDGFDVDNFPEDVFRKPDERPDDGGVVEFIHVIFVVERGVGRLKGFCELVGFAGLFE